MKLLKKLVRKYLRRKAKERGSALIIVTLLLALLTIYVSASLTITTTDTVSSNFEVAQQKGYYTAFSKLEQMSRDFSSLFLNSTNPSYDSLCRVVLAPPDALNNFQIVKPNVSCPPGSACSAGYSSNDYSSSNLFDLGWVGQSKFCIVDVCNPTVAKELDGTTLCKVDARPPFPLQINTGTYSGLQAFIRRYRQVASVTNQVRGGADVQLTRDFDNLLLPLFQFGIFSDTDFELYVPPNWAFGGWVHTNNDFYLTSNAGQNIRFSQYFADANNNVSRGPARISVGKHMIIGNEKFSNVTNTSTRMLYDIDTAGNTRFLDENQGSAVTGARAPANCNRIAGPSQDVVVGTCGPLNTQEQPIITTGAPRLQLPIQTILNANPIQLIRRGLSSDFDPSRSSPYFSARYFYKPSIRITLADYQSQLPRTLVPGDDVTNPTSASGAYGGVQLDAPDPVLAMTGVGTKAAGFPTANPNWFYMPDDTVPGMNNRPLPRGYVPKVINPGDNTPRPTGARVNGHRIHGWIKIEVVRSNGVTQDITQEILNLGVTVPYSANPTGTTRTTFYYPRGAASFPPQAYRDDPLPFGTGPFPDENSILHLQRFAVPYTNSQVGTLTPNTMPANLQDPTLPQGLDNLTNVVIDYYSSMARRAFNNPANLSMFGIEDNLDGGRYTTPSAAGAYSEPQYDRGGYYTDADPGIPGQRTTLNSIPGRMILPVNSNLLPRQSIDFSGNANATTSNYVAQQTAPDTRLTENANTPKKPFVGAPGDTAPNSLDKESVIYDQGETTWSLMDSGGTRRRLVPFPVNMYDSREGTPHEPNAGVAPDPPVPGLVRTAVSKVGTMNLVEVDMGNLGRLLKGNFDTLFAQMGNTPYRAATGGPLTAAQLRDNIDLNQDNGWLVYISDRRGDEPVVNSNPNVKLAAAQLPNPTAGTPSLIGDGEYNREDVVWSDGGNTGAGNPAAIQVATSGAPMAAPFGCDPMLNSNNRDEGKSPQDANNDCFIATETATRSYSETAPYNAGFYRGTLPPAAGNVTAEDQYDGTRTYGAPIANTTARIGNIIAMTQVPSNSFSQAGAVNREWSRKPPPVYDADPTMRRIELFRRAIRLVNATNLFPTGPSIGDCRFPLGVNVISENPVYVFGGYNTPVAEVDDIGDAVPGLTGAGVPTVVVGPDSPTRPTFFNGSDFRSCGDNCHVPAAIVADAITLLSGACVGTGNTNWSAAGGFAGWLDSRSFVTPYQAIGFRPARNTVYRFALVSGFTPSWFGQYWNGVNGANALTIHQGTNSRNSSGALNNFPRFLEDWAQNNTNPQFATYAGSLIRIYKSTQGNGAFKRVGAADATANFVTAGEVDYVYRPPNRDWIFDTDFNNPCTLPPGSPFLQLVDFKGFQQSQVQRQRPN